MKIQRCQLFEHNGKRSRFELFKANISFTCPIVNIYYSPSKNAPKPKLTTHVNITEYHICGGMKTFLRVEKMKPKIKMKFGRFRCCCD